MTWKLWWRRRRSQPKDPYAGYAATIFLDANIVLEGKPFAELPWSEIHSEGPILVLFLPQVLREIDDKKRDARLGMIARNFSRIISPATILGSRPVTLFLGPPQVDATLAVCTKIPWDLYDEFDIAEGDSRVVAELLHAKDPPIERRLLVSGDVNPVAKASRRGVRTLHASSTWLRPREMSKAERELQGIRQKQAEREASAPKLNVTFSIPDDAPIEILRVKALTSDQRSQLQERILQLNPKRSQASASRFGPRSLGIGLDHTLDKRHARYVEQTVPGFVRSLEENLEREYGQFPFSIEIENVGTQPARRLVVDIRVEEGWINDRIVIPQTRFPGSPYPRDNPYYFDFPKIDPIPRPHKPHDFYFSEEPAKGTLAIAQCADFRHGTSWTFQGSAWADPRSAGTFKFRVEVDADGLDEPLVQERVVNIRVTEAQCEELVDLATGKRLRPSRIESALQTALKSDRLHDLEIESDD